ncbi:putative dephospho-CoA kinase [Trypanosoma grayi]|uniref:putative dephospho-CoA kinase n=1 Tax=Trypanosoma grayi TaxID=71804 RepID=UPI0004F48381|nr:putative dephospho-CoA kinase [Trypanosoma grayi]KEG12025.1 putative dephospho-CoA kinase [Trypanosoma grayi]
MILIGLTGGIACGKSTVSALLVDRYQLTVIDADQVVRELQCPGKPCTRKIAKRWPECVDTETGEINRTALGKIIFCDAQARRELTNIMNLPIFVAITTKLLRLWWRSMWRRTLEGEAPPLVVLDVPLLYESNIYTWFIDAAVVVACDEAQQIARLEKRNGFTREQAVQRIRAQMPIAEKCRRADRVIRNNGTLAELESSVDTTVMWMRRQPGSRLTRLVVATVVGGVGCAAGAVYLFRLLL